MLPFGIRSIKCDFTVHLPQSRQNRSLSSNSIATDTDKQTRHNMATALVYGLFAVFACIVSLISQAVIRALLNVYSNTAANKHYSTVPAVGKPHWLLGHVFLVFKTNGHQIFDFITARMQTMQTKVRHLCCSLSRLHRFQESTSSPTMTRRTPNRQSADNTSSTVLTSAHQLPGQH